MKTSNQKKVVRALGLGALAFCWYAAAVLAAEGDASEPQPPAQLAADGGQPLFETTDKAIDLSPAVNVTEGTGTPKAERKNNLFVPRVEASAAATDGDAPVPATEGDAPKIASAGDAPSSANTEDVPTPASAGGEPATAGEKDVPAPAGAAGTSTLASGDDSAASEGNDDASRGVKPVAEGQDRAGAADPKEKGVAVDAPEQPNPQPTGAAACRAASSPL